jgi:hypothetical protein
MVHVETELVGRGGVWLEMKRGLELRLGVHLGGTGDEISGREGEVFEESEGPIEDILGERKDKILYISEYMQRSCSQIIIYLFIYTQVRRPVRTARPGTAV